MLHVQGNAGQRTGRWNDVCIEKCAREEKIGIFLQLFYLFFSLFCRMHHTVQCDFRNVPGYLGTAEMACGNYRGIDGRTGYPAGSKMDRKSEYDDRAGDGTSFCGGMSVLSCAAYWLFSGGNPADCNFCLFTAVCRGWRTRLHGRGSGSVRSGKRTFYQ